jgi:hypothetical protein
MVSLNLRIRAPNVRKAGSEDVRQAKLGYAKARKVLSKMTEVRTGGKPY